MRSTHLPETEHNGFTALQVSKVALLTTFRRNGQGLVNHRQGQTTRPQSTGDVGSIYKDGDEGDRSNGRGYGSPSGGGRGGKVVSSLQIWPLGSYVEPDLSVARLAEGPL